MVLRHAVFFVVLITCGVSFCGDVCSGDSSCGVYSYGADYFLSAIPHDSRKSKITNYRCFQQIAELAGVEFISAPIELFKQPEIYYFEKDIHLNASGLFQIRGQPLRQEWCPFHRHGLVWLGFHVQVVWP